MLKCSKEVKNSTGFGETTLTLKKQKQKQNKNKTNHLNSNSEACDENPINELTD